jgi:hypothetical protein
MFSIALRIAMALSFALGASLTSAAEPSPNLKELWDMVRAQQQQITDLKDRLARSESAAQKSTETRPHPEARDSAPINTKKPETDRRTDILAAEVEKLKSSLAIPETRQYKAQYGMGPAASGVYAVNRGLSLGGYGEGSYTHFGDQKGDNRDRIDLTRLVLYAGYKFSDRIVLNNEIEFEHASTGEGSEEKGEVSVEFSQLDFFLHPKANARAGLLLMPMGFINEIHEPVTFHGVRRPEVERNILPSTWSEMGGGLFGEILPGLHYRMYAVNGLDASKFTSEGIREGHGAGSQSLAESFAFTGRLDYVPDFASGWLLGGSVYSGDAGQNGRLAGRKLNVNTQLYEGHLQWHYRGLEMRALGAYGQIGDAGPLSNSLGQTIGSQQYGWYVEGAYDVMPWLARDNTQYLAPFLRFERYDNMAQVARGFTRNRFFDRKIYQAGLTYKPIPNVVIKADFRHLEAGSGVLPQEFNLGLGFIY